MVWMEDMGGLSLSGAPGGGGVHFSMNVGVTRCCLGAVGGGRERVCLLLHEIHASTQDGLGGRTLSLASLLVRQGWAKPVGFTCALQSSLGSPWDS